MPFGETWLNVAEKPSVAREASRVLANGSFRQAHSYSRFNAVSEFEMPVGHSSTVRMLFTSVAGHLMEDTFPPSVKNWVATPFVELFHVPITKVVKNEFKDCEKNIQEYARQATRLVLWLDCDAEGENICFEVISVVRRVNSRIAVSRARFSSLTPRDLFFAVAHLVEPNYAQSQAVDARQEMDLRIGAAFTRFQTVSFQERFAELPKIISFGPCQFPCLGFVIHRHNERETFVPEKFFYCSMSHQTTNSGQVVFMWDRGNIYSDYLSAATLYETMITTASLATITNVDRKPRHRLAPVPLATVEMQKLASSLLRIPAERCMSLAESLYQEGYISYPRTETESYGNMTDDELREVIRVQEGSAQWGAYATALLAASDKYKRPRNGTHNDNAHPPIHPKKAYDGRQGDEKTRLYELIARHFLAQCSRDAIAAETKVRAEFGEEAFHAAGHTIVEKNWLDVFVYERWNNTAVPNYETGDSFSPTEVILREGTTEAPPLLSEANLIAMMDANGIGTDATIAQHIKTIQDREYVFAEQHVFKPTKLGLALASAYAQIGLEQVLHPQLRAQMELAMHDIARGAATKNAVVESAIQMYKELFLRVAGSRDAMIAHMSLFLAPNNNGGSAAEYRGPSTVINAAFAACGQCKTPTTLQRRGAPGEERCFVCCDQCHIALKMPSARLQYSVHGAECMICGFGVATVINPERNSSYQLCPYCNSNPPVGNVIDVEAAAGGGMFACFQCVHDRCPLASGAEQVPIGPCPACKSNVLRIRKRAAQQRTGGSMFFVGCKGYPHCTYTIGLPPCESLRVSPHGTKCGACRTYTLVVFRFVAAQIIPMMDPETETCLFCDDRLTEYLAARGGPDAAVPSPAQAARPPAQATDGPPQVSRSQYVMPTVPPKGSRGGRGDGGGRGRGGGGPRGAALELSVNCRCGVPAVELVSKKESSRGRRFRTCNSRTCNFFEWIE